MGDTVRINGVQISWSSVKLKIAGQPYSGIKSIEYADGVETSLSYGMGKHHAPRGSTRGKYVPEPFVLDCFTSTAKAIREDLNKLAGRRGIANVPVAIILQYVEPDDAVITVEALDAKLTKNESSHEEGPDALSEKLSFQPMRIKRNGIALYDTTEAGA
ncbi:hypothetical protein [Sandaracinus amylolyticus]|uniref:Uncharacterized protein n=1 Tax=Sandaracinus amylolyticus TaxID=927083 RepID=A0A0F6YHR5_9BACT|nr:hypothetical protein [Sandaracinus amylolyticus]AKF06078.1 hypothetical protein DB32_003227 [Sandaracinus amylolyticus]